VDRRAELRPILAQRLAQRSTADWVNILDKAGIPNGAIADVAAAFDSPEAQELAMTVEVEHPAFGILRQVGIPLTFESTPGAIRTAPPLLGEHTDEVLAAAGVTAEELAVLRRDGVV
jgi:formyl-CoA transferase/CoA:oxalate CoA-transferase